MKKFLIGFGVIVFLFYAVSIAIFIRYLVQSSHNNQWTVKDSVSSQTYSNVVLVSAPSKDPIIGLWGGKWDDTWPVFLTIKTNNEPNTYQVRYQWLENFNDAAFSTRELSGYKTNDYVHAKFLDFQMTQTNGTLYGEFKTPRMANLVRIDPSDNPSSENANEILEHRGWTANAISADKALKKIQEQR